ncbi:butyrophilin subfamily 1 member A1-like [Rhea pennata]|uniref:butyrophilin subfamily 1 member A1-like n=1 Tax=Rhea pennata TaxID=8795 RepID=UPI002E26946C
MVTLGCGDTHPPPPGASAAPVSAVTVPGTSVDQYRTLQDTLQHYRPVCHSIDQYAPVETALVCYAPPEIGGPTMSGTQHEPQVASNVEPRVQGITRVWMQGESEDEASVLGVSEGHLPTSTVQGPLNGPEELVEVQGGPVKHNTSAGDRGVPASAPEASQEGRLAPFRVIAPAHSVVATLGQDVVLPCHLMPEQSARAMEVTWFRGHFSPYVHRYKAGMDQHGDQMPQYQGRTELLQDGLDKGSVALKIFSVRLSDEGRYTCFIRADSDYEEAVLDLKVTDPFFQNAQPWKIALSLVVVTLIVLFIITLYLFKTKATQLEELLWRRYAMPIEEVEVTLDPDTARCNLVLSDDCKSVKRVGKPQDVPDNPERFKFSSCVLGCEGFTSGRYYWEVEVENGGGWTVGVSSENVKRKENIMFKPEEGIWAVGQWAGQFQAFTFPEHTVFFEIQELKRIRVSVDYEEGRVAFFNVDEETPIFTFPLVSFNGIRIHPWFWLGPGTQLKMWP